MKKIIKNIKTKFTVGCLIFCILMLIITSMIIDNIGVMTATCFTLMMLSVIGMITSAIFLITCGSYWEDEE